VFCYRLQLILNILTDGLPPSPPKSYTILRELIKKTGEELQLARPKNSA